MATTNKPISWIRTLAAPYLRGYRARAASSGGLRGYWFAAGSSPHGGSRAAEAGFFVGYVLDAKSLPYLSPQPPECLVFAFANPPQSAPYRRLVVPENGLFRRTFHYIRWLTHRPPRFVFHPDQMCILTRHRSMADWPLEKHEHYSRNFFIETLAWLVRSGLVRKLAEEAATPPVGSRRTRKKILGKPARKARRRS